MDDLNEQIRLHSAGATVRYKSTFADLTSYNNVDELSQDFIDTWAAPFYMRIGDTDDSWTNQLIQAKEQITKEIVALQQQQQQQQQESNTIQNTKSSDTDQKIISYTEQLQQLLLQPSSKKYSFLHTIKHKRI